jgi:hypothetical protein
LKAMEYLRFSIDFFILNKSRSCILGLVTSDTCRMGSFQLQSGKKQSQAGRLKAKVKVLSTVYFAPPDWTPTASKENYAHTVLRFANKVAASLPS